MSAGLQTAGGSPCSNGPHLVGAAPVPTQCCCCSASPRVVFSGQQPFFLPGASSLPSQPLNVAEQARLPVMPGHRIETNSIQSVVMSGHAVAVQPIQNRGLPDSASSTIMIRSSRNDLPVESSNLSSPQAMVGPNASPILSDHSMMAKPIQSSQLRSSRIAGHAALAVPISSPESQTALDPAAPARQFTSPMIFDHALASRSVVKHPAAVPQSTTTMSAGPVSLAAATNPQRWISATQSLALGEQSMESRVIRERSVESRVVGERSITREELFRSGHLIVAGGAHASPVMDITSSNIMNHHASLQSQLDDTIRVPMSTSMAREDPFLPGRWIKSNQDFPAPPTLHAADPSENDTEALFPEHALMHPAAAAAFAAKGSAPYEDTSEALMPTAPGNFLDVFNAHDGIVVDKEEALVPHADSDFWETFPRSSLPRAAPEPAKHDHAPLDLTTYLRCWPDPSER